MKTVKSVFFFFLLASCFCNDNDIHRTMLDLIETKSTKEMFKLWHYALQRPYDLNSEVALQKYKVFKQNLKRIKETNSKGLTFKLGLGPFTDYTWEEFKQSHLMTNRGNTKKEENSKASKTFNFDELADAEDSNDLHPRKLREISFDELADKEEEKAEIRNNKMKSADSPDWSYLSNGVRDQNNCGSCWAFAAVGITEMICKKELNKNFDLSEQELIDCDIDGDNDGCEGGFEDLALDFIKRNGISSERNYPYTSGVSGQRGACKNIPDDEKAVIISSFFSFGEISYFNSRKKVYSFNVDDVYSRTPSLASIQVLDGMQHYKEGTWLEGYCTKVNHAVIGVQVTEDYIKIKNSWGRWWGERGYGKISRDHPGTLTTCGAEDYLSAPEGCIEISKNRK